MKKGKRLQDGECSIFGVNGYKKVNFLNGKMMDILSDDITTLVFRRAVNVDSGNVSLDGQMLNVLSKLDGRKNLGMISREIGIDMSAMRSVISKLGKLKLIEAVKEDMPVLDKEFFDFLTDQLSIIAGPIAQVMVEDAIRDMPHDSSAIPVNRAAELIEMLSRQIADEQKRTSFIQTVLTRIK